MPAENRIDFSPCCACGKEDETVRNLMILHLKTLIPGTGWGCFVCNLPADGAYAIYCDECVGTKAPIKFAVAGYLTMKQRGPIEKLTEEFDHGDLLHLLVESKEGGQA